MPQLVSLQVLRAAAALAIAFLHADHEAGLLSGAGPTALRLFFPWEAGVDVFFVVSGFVMAYASGPLFGRPGAARTFAARRVARIVPLYWLLTTAFLLLVAVRPDLLRGAEPIGPAAIAASYLFIPYGPAQGIAQPVYSLGWTLNFEMLFYAVFAAFIGFRRRPALLGTAATMGALIAAGLLWPLPQPLRTWSNPMAAEFVLGTALGLARAEGAVLPRAVRIGLAGLAVIALAAIGGDAVARTGWPQGVLFGLPAAALVAAFGLVPVGSTPPGAGAGRLLRSGAVLGDASYAIYLIHPFVIRPVRIAAGFAAPALGMAPGSAGLRAGVTAAALLATIAAALATWRFVERPLTRALRRLLEARRAPDQGFSR